jgi:hypothetical protein
MNNGNLFDKSHITLREFQKVGEQRQMLLEKENKNLVELATFAGCRKCK